MASFEDIQFRCKMCQFTAMSKQEMADHFMDIHATMEIVGTRDPQAVPLAAPLAAEEEEGAPEATVGEDDGSAADKSEPAASEEKWSPPSSKAPGKKRPGFRSNAIRSTISHLVRAAEQASKDDWINSEGSSRLLQTRNKTVHAVGRELRKHKRKRKFEDFVLYGKEHPSMSKTKQPRISYTKRSAGRKAKVGRGQQTEGRSQKKMLRKKGGATSTLSKPENEFKEKVTAELMQWSAKWSETHKGVMEICQSTGCGLQLPASEMRLHMQCHMRSFYGFRCPHCKFMHSRWPRMRCHIYDDHDGLEKPMLKCDWPDCSTSSTNLVGLKRHVLRDHIREKVRKMGTPKQEDPPAATDGNEIKNEHATNLEETNDDAANLEETNDDAANLEESNDDAANLEESNDVEYFIPRRKRKVGKKKKEAEDDTDDANGTGEAAKVVKKRKFSRAAWLPSCSVCEAKYIAVEYMDTHMALHVVEGSEGVKCSECLLIMDSESSLKAHMKEHHKRMLKVYRCDKCKYAGDRHHDFKKHLITHEDSKPCMCEMCGKLMSTGYNLKVHLLRVHATDEQKTIHCDHCTYRCADNIVLKDHMRFQHNLLWNGDPYRDIEKLQTFRCDKCSYVGRKEKSLKYHMRVHTENRQFRCNICSYASKTKNNLILHMRTHEGLKPIKCSQCDYRGATNKVVEEHILSKHKGLRPFRCPCGWSTAYSGNMWKHMQEHRQKEDAFKDIAAERYSQKSKKKKLDDNKATTSATQSPQKPQLVTIVHEFRAQDGTATQLSSDSQQPSQVITFSEGSQAIKDVPGSSKYSQVAVLPIIGGQVQLNNLVEAVGMVTTTAAGKDGGMTAADQQRQEEDSQAANFLCKLAQAVTTTQLQKQASEAKEIPVECQVQTSDGTVVEQTIQDFILW